VQFLFNVFDWAGAFLKSLIRAELNSMHEIKLDFQFPFSIFLLCHENFY